MQIIDLSQPLEQGSLCYPGTESGVSIDRLPVDVPGITVSVFSKLDPHSGTHFDAPLHFIPQSDDVATTPLAFPEIIVISSSESPLPPEVLDGHPALQGKAVLFLTGWEQHAGTKEFFEGFPVLSHALAERLVGADAALVGIDTPSVDPAHGSYPAHRMLLAAGISIIEGLVNLSALIPDIEQGRLVRLAAFPLRIQGLEGSPVRAVALIE